MEYEIIVAYCSLNRGIGYKGRLPWNLPLDLEHFAQITTNAPEGCQNAVIMGRQTWLSIPRSRRPLKNRVNLVLTSHPDDLGDDLGVYSSFDHALNSLKKRSDIHKVFVIGGERVYHEALNDSRCVRIHLTEVYYPFECDTFFPVIDNVFKISNSSDLCVQNGICFRFITLDRTK